MKGLRRRLTILCKTEERKRKKEEGKKSERIRKIQRAPLNPPPGTQHLG